MKIVIAMDSFKSSLSSLEAAEAVQEGIKKVLPAEVVIKPLADGGEGTMEALTKGLGGKIKEVKVTGPLGQQVIASYGLVSSQRLAIIEMAEAAGITLTKEKDPMAATTYGVGELIREVLANGNNRLILCIGGSATNDGGVGMLQALGYRFFDQRGNELGQGGGILEKIHSVCDKNRMHELDDCQIKVACDVTNPLYGPDGATCVYGPQKGVTEELLPILEAGMKHWGQITTAFIQLDMSREPGAGAAGGLGFALKSYLGAELVSGIELVLETVQLETDLKNADVLITGEGRLDRQSAMGKGPTGVAKLAKKYGVKVIALAGCLGEGAHLCNQEGIDAYFTILNQVLPLEKALNKENAKENMRAVTEQVFRLLL